MQQRVGGHGGCYEALGVSLSETAPGAEHGGRSKYSMIALETECG